MTEHQGQAEARCAFIFSTSMVCESGREKHCGSISSCPERKQGLKCARWHHFFVPPQLSEATCCGRGNFGEPHDCEKSDGAARTTTGNLLLRAE